VNQKQRPVTNKASQASPEWVVTLSDGSNVVGNPTTFPDLKATAELGDYSISWKGILRIVFSSPQTTHAITPNGPGTRAITFYPIEGGKQIVTGATFFSERTNENNCFTGFNYMNNVKFTTEAGAEYNITFDKFRELRVLGRNEYSASVQLVSSSGTQFTGRMDALGVQGISRIGAFDLLFTVPFDSPTIRPVGTPRFTVDEK
jgi:hypothetical protein